MIRWTALYGRALVPYPRFSAEVDNAREEGKGRLEGCHGDAWSGHVALSAAPSYGSGAVDTLVFNAYVEQVLRPCVQPGDILVLDNLGAHRASHSEDVAAASGARVIWIPPYSPDYSPIEHLWSKVKEALRAAKARTRDALEDALTNALTLVSEADIRGWFSHCGYEVALK